MCTLVSTTASIATKFASYLFLATQNLFLFHSQFYLIVNNGKTTASQVKYCHFKSLRVFIAFTRLKLCGEVLWRSGVEEWCGGVVSRSGVEEWCGGVVWRSGVEEWCGGVVWRSGVEEW